MSKVQTRFHSGLFLDETATLCHWHVPGGALSRGVERRAHGRRHRVDRAAADSADVRRQVGARRSSQTLLRSAGAQRLRPRARVLDGAAASAGARVRRCRRCAGATGAQVRTAAAARPVQPRAPACTGDVSTAPAAACAQLPPPPPTPEQRAAATFEKNWRRGCTTALLREPRSPAALHAHRSHLPHRARTCGTCTATTPSRRRSR